MNKRLGGGVNSAPQTPHLLFLDTGKIGKRALLGLAGALVASAAQAQGLTPEQRQEVIEILRRALREDPSILRDAVTAMQQAEERERGNAARAAIAQNRDALFASAADPVKGNPRGDVSIVEFFDARCPYCKRLHGEMDQLVRRDRNVRVVLKDIPILGPLSVTASRALLAAQRQGKYVELYDALLRLRGEPTEDVLQQESTRIGLDWTRMRREMEDPAIQQRLDANLRLAQALRIEGTPALVIGDTVIPGAVTLDTLERLVAEQRQQARR